MNPDRRGARPGLGGVRAGAGWIAVPLTQWQSGRVTTIKINAITVPAGSGDGWRTGSLLGPARSTRPTASKGSSCCDPTDEREQWLVITRWRDEESFQAWVSSPGFAEGHRSAVERAGGEAPRPVSTHSEVWNYEVAGGSSPGSTD